MKGIVLAGGSATRMRPATNVVNKHLLPVYNKPLIYYPISTLMLLGVREILITSQADSLPFFEKLLGDGSQFGVKFCYKVQPEAGGIAEVILLADGFVNKDERFITILGDNIFYIPHIRQNLVNLLNLSDEAGVLLSHVYDPHRFGIAGFDSNDKLESVEEKPTNPKSNWAITGLYFYDYKAIQFAKQSVRSARGELEVTAVNHEYLNLGKLEYVKLPRGSVWLDAGTPQSMFEAAEFVKIAETRQGLMIGNLEEVAFNMGYISREQLLKLASGFKSGCMYGEYLKQLLAV